MRIFLTLIIALVLVAGSSWYMTTTPAFAIREAAAALKACDSVRFERAVDVGATAGELFDELAASPELARGLGDAVGIQLGGGLVQSFGAVMKPMIGSMAAGAVKDFVGKCKLFAPELKGPASGLKPLAAALDRPFAAEMIGLKAWMSTDSEADRLAAMTIDAVKVELREDENGWRVIRIEGALALLAKTR